MQLEVIERHPESGSEYPPLLFIHGAFGGAWCWDEHFIDYFVAAGYSCYAVSLRGHGNSEGDVYMASLQDYLEDVRQVVEQIPVTPILIGHSMGGMVIQKYLEAKLPAAAVVLMASVPPTGLFDSAWQMGIRMPWLSWQLGEMYLFGPQFATTSGLHRLLFSEHMDPKKVHRFTVDTRGESMRVLWDMMGLNLPLQLRHSPVPMLVMGAAEDIIFPPPLIQGTGAWYRSPVKIVPGMAHAMMLEDTWENAASALLEWLYEQELGLAA